MGISDKSILIVEDEDAIRDMVRFALERSEFQASAAANAAEARTLIANKRPDLILMDWMMPGVSGIELARELKADASTRDIPIIMLTARAEEGDKVRGLTIGCDDYVSKPFSVPELMARIQAVLRRSTPGGEEEKITAAGLDLDHGSQRVSANGQPVKLGPTEYRLLHFFMSHPERVYTREQVLNRVWGQNVYVEERTVDVHIRRLRRSLEPHGLDGLIQTVRGSGYRFSEKTDL